MIPSKTLITSVILVPPQILCSAEDDHVAAELRKVLDAIRNDYEITLPEAWASLTIEGGFNWISNSPNGKQGSLGKITLAPRSRSATSSSPAPVLRAFVTCALWNDVMQGSVGGPDYANETSELSWGVQMES
jgi:maltoporin